MASSEAIPVVHSTAADASLPSRIILFDGVCNLCNRSVTFIIDRDPERHFKFASLQSSRAGQILSSHGMGSGALSSVVLIEDGKIYTRSTAALRIASRLRWPTSLMRVLLVIPRPIRDVVYDWIARNRYRWFGKLDSCRLPDAQLASRFLVDEPETSATIISNS